MEFYAESLLIITEIESLA